MPEETKEQAQEAKKEQEETEKKEQEQETELYVKEEFDVKKTKEFQNMERLKTKWHNRAKELEESNQELQDRNTKLEQDLESYIEELSNLQQAMDKHRKRAERITDTVHYALNSLQSTVNSTISTLNIIDARHGEDE